MRSHLTLLLCQCVPLAVSNGVHRDRNLAFCVTVMPGRRRWHRAPVTAVTSSAARGALQPVSGPGLHACSGCQCQCQC